MVVLSDDVAHSNTHAFKHSVRQHYALYSTKNQSFCVQNPFPSVFVAGYGGPCKTTAFWRSPFSSKLSEINVVFWDTSG